ncbi:MAG: glutathione S-transferase N-terminal domain-containing protein [Candidatus Omnitrophica bacterium]|nr:glutathione S-transferase N-terminal domain-containing protein [Candidatus Omnitrophota bacterium]
MEQTVKVYSTPTCPYCVRVKAYLKEKGVAFEDIDVSNNQGAAMEMVKLSGQMGVPVIAVGSEVIVGFDKGRLESLLG